MNTFYTICTLSVLLATSALAQRFDVTMVVDSTPRQFIVVRPTGNPPAGGYPIVFMFHGTSGDGEKFYNISGWKEKGEEEKFITVFPSSLEYCIIEDSQPPHKTTKWNCGDLLNKACPNQYFKDDVKFVRMMIDTIEKTFNINTRRIYVSGFSNGAGFGYKLAIEMSDVLACVGVSGGGLDQLDSATPKRPIAIWHMFGTLDDRQYVPRGLTEMAFNDTILRQTASLQRRTLGASRLDTIYTKVSTPRMLSYRFNTPLGSDPAGEVVFSIVDSMTHEYPNGTNYPLRASDFFWQYFSQFSLSTSVDTRQVAAQPIELFPNPTYDNITVRGEGQLLLILRSYLGTEVLRKTITGGQSVSLAGLPSGMYLAQITQGSVRREMKVVVR